MGQDKQLSHFRLFYLDNQKIYSKFAHKNISRYDDTAN